MSSDDMLITFLQRYLGVPNTGDILANMGQCVGLVELWMTMNGKPHVWGNADQLLSGAPTLDYTVVKNAPSNYPPPGAIICWDQTWGRGAGHTAIVLAATPWIVAVFEQNNPEGSAPVVATHDYTGVQGWMVFK